MIKMILVPVLSRRNGIPQNANAIDPGAPSARLTGKTATVALRGWLQSQSQRPVSRLQSPRSRLPARSARILATPTKPRDGACRSPRWSESIIAPGHLIRLGPIAVLAPPRQPPVPRCAQYVVRRRHRRRQRLAVCRALIHDADGRQAHHEPRAGQAPRRRPPVPALTQLRARFDDISARNYGFCQSAGAG